MADYLLCIHPYFKSKNSDKGLPSDAIITGFGKIRDDVVNQTNSLAAGYNSEIQIRLKKQSHQPPVKPEGW